MFSALCFRIGEPLVISKSKSDFIVGPVGSEVLELKQESFTDY